MLTVTVAVAVAVVVHLLGVECAVVATLTAAW
jgi:hypothetical protein